MRHCAWLVGVFTLTLLAGCSNARLVSSTPTGGCVAVADSTDSWPAYNMTKARELMQKQCPSGYSIVKQEEVVVGQTTTNSTRQDTKEVPLAKGLALDVQQTTHNSTDVRDRTEFRIWFQKK